MFRLPDGAMKLVVPLLLVLSTGFVCAAPPAEADSPESRKARELVAQLASPRYKDREKAAAELIKMGRAAKIALQEGKAHKDPEVQTRCQQLLPQALALDLAFRIDRYVKDSEGKLEHDLPLLKTYREKIGTDENARKLFAEMLTANGALLETVAEEPGKVTELVQRRIQEMYQELFGNPFGGGFRGGYQPGRLNANELCCVMFAASSSTYKPSQPDWMISNLFTQPNFTNQLKDEKAGSAYRKLFFHYLETRMDDNTINQCVWMLSQHKIKEGAEIIAKALKNGKATQVYTKASAMCCIGTLGGKEHIQYLEPLLKDDSQVQQFFARGRQGGWIKVRDVALAMTIHLNGKNPKDYGFTMWAVYPNQLIQYHQLGFESDEARTAAFKKWEEEQKKAEPKPKK
jgi:hypothetical protein